MASASNLAEQGLANIPNLELATLSYCAGCSSYTDDERTAAKTKLLEEVKSKNLTPLYEWLCSELKMKVDKSVVEMMRKENERKVAELDEKIRDAKENLGETEIRDALVAKAEYLCNIGEKEESVSALRLVYEKTATAGSKLDVVFYHLRIGLFFMDNDIIARNLEKARSLVEEGGDWDRRNRLKVYEGLYCLATRDFSKAAENFLDSVSTFTSYELMDYNTFVMYTVVAAMISLPRVDLKAKVIQGSEIQEVLHQLPLMKTFLTSLYECQYGQFFRALAEVEVLLKRDRYLSPHYRYYIREMRVLVYNQLLKSYRSLTLQYMADAFEVSIDFIDRELSRFIASGRLNCKIDKVGGFVETNRPDHKNWQYQAAIKQGDMLLNRLQKLSRVINV
ncbi:26S proteasome non-ATPase regulatory subunit 6-like [Corticium candelabrum]|uniref:26S proteasome non-ATPase regulatory subunit 6-like n=1 Tax=Corticium candelabrum TaxID=121492 RepID=UPI002E27735A|nr:26S proteasome non-ATPase regulatory subunit 6-like [Corticium candelabrum]